MQGLQDSQRDVLGLIDRFKLSLKLSPSVAKGDEKEWQVDQNITVSEELESLLDDYLLAINPRDYGRDSIRPRLDAILFEQLAKVKKAHQSDDNYEPSCAPSNPLWVYQQKLTLDIPSEGEIGKQDLKEPLDVVVTYALKYRERPGIDLNLVVLRKDALGLEAESEEVLTAMTVVHHARKAVGDVADLYGLHTDSFNWRFFHVNNSGQYSKLSLYWDTDQQKIVGLIWKIMDQAMVLAQIVRNASDTVQDLHKADQEESASDSRV